MTDAAALFDRAAEGDPDAIDRWFRREHPPVYRLCLGFLADAEAAEDLAQDAMLHLLDSHSHYDDQRSWSAWRNTLVLNLCRDAQRRNASRARAEEVGGELAHLRDRDTLPDPSEVAAAGEVHLVVAEALAELTPREREAFVLRDLEGADTAEVAATLGVTPSTVRSLLTLARRRLRALLGPKLAEVGGRDVEGPDG